MADPDRAVEAAAAGYIYRGDRLTDPSLKGRRCTAVPRADGKCVTGRSAMLVLFAGETTPRVILRRQLRKIPPHLAGHLASYPPDWAFVLPTATDPRLSAVSPWIPVDREQGADDPGLAFVP